MKVVILAWGNGTRLWPVSRETFPKQFNKLDTLGWESLFQKSLKRALFLTEEKDIYIVISKENFFHAEIQAEELWMNISSKNFIIQPLMKETLPIIILSIKHIWNDNILFLPSDHIIEGLKDFKKKIELWLEKARDSIVIFRVKPDKIDTWLWYIKKEDKKSLVSRVSSFHEKPVLGLAVVISILSVILIILHYIARNGFHILSRVRLFGKKHW
jgi:mannose-1-phosphate guanylyltransferase/mannose-6-phosphate isomerase